MNIDAEYSGEEVINWNLNGLGLDSALDKFTKDDLPNNAYAIVCDPVSIIHLLSKSHDYMGATDEAISERKSTLFVQDARLMSYIRRTVDAKIIELVRFLTEGGVLVYFLRPPFFVLSPSLGSLVFDNYCWLNKLRPNQGDVDSNPMMARCHADFLSVTEAGKSSDFAEYLQVLADKETVGIEDNQLLPDYQPLAMVNDAKGKCFVTAAKLEVGACGGHIVFLPEPSSDEERSVFAACLAKTVEGRRKSQQNADLHWMEDERVQSSTSLMRLQLLLTDASHSVPEPISTGDENKLALHYEDLLDLIIHQSAEEIALKLNDLFLVAGWNVIKSEHNQRELFVGLPDGDFVVIRVTPDDPDALISDLSRLAQANIAAWAEHMKEPRALLVGISRDIFAMLSNRMKCTGFDAHGFAKRNNIELRNTVQLAGLLKRHLSGNLTEEEVCKLLVYGGANGANGPGYDREN